MKTKKDKELRIFLGWFLLLVVSCFLTLAVSDWFIILTIVSLITFMFKLNELGGIK